MASAHDPQTIVFAGSVAGGLLIIFSDGASAVYPIGYLRGVMQAMREYHAPQTSDSPTTGHIRVP